MVTPERSDTSVIPHPLHIQFHPTNRCNLNCIFCWLHDDHQTYPELPDERWLTLTREACALQARRVTISGGGEPLLRPNLVVKMMELLAKAGIPGHLITNGTLLTESLAQRMVELGWQDVMFSLQGSTAEIADSVEGATSAFTRSLKAIGILNDVKQQRGSELPQLSIRVVITRHNFEDLPNIIRLAARHAVSYASLRLVNEAESNASTGRSMPKRRMTELYAKIEKTRTIAKENRLPLQFEFDPEQLVEPPMQREGHRVEASPSPLLACPLPFSEIVVFSNGIVSPCCKYFAYQFEMPNESEGLTENAEETSLLDLWRQGFSRLRRSIAGGEPPEECRVCSPDLKHQIQQWPESLWQAEFVHYKRNGQYRRAIDLGLRQLKSHPKAALLHHHIGECHMELGKYEQAKDHLSSALELQPKMEWTHFSLGKCHSLSGKHKEAEGELRKNISLTSNRLSHYHSWLFLAMTADALNDTRGCKKALDSLKDFSEYFGKEIKLEREFLSRLKREKRLPAFLSALPSL